MLTSFSNQFHPSVKKGAAMVKGMLTSATMEDLLTETAAVPNAKLSQDTLAEVDLQIQLTLAVPTDQARLLSR